MKLDKKIIGMLPLSVASRKTVESPLRQMPRLVSDESLGQASEQLADATRQKFTHGYRPVVETITMPKYSFGQRPITVLSPETRTLYSAVVYSLGSLLPESSKKEGHLAHEQFGLQALAEEARVVDFDIAGCFEYIEHSILADELIVQGASATTVAALVDLLRSMFPRGLGLPQALEESHALADIYLNIVERNILRLGYVVNRYVDDYRVIARDWSDAHEVIGRAVDYARATGLVLADGKTKIRKPSTIRAEIEDRDRAIAEYRSQAEDSLRVIDFVRISYDEFDIVETEPDDSEVDYEAMARVIQDWVAGHPESQEQRAALSFVGPRALKLLQTAPNRVPDDTLVKIVEREPLRLASVVGYVESRAEQAENWRCLGKLVRISRQGPWTRLWLATLGARLNGPTNDSATEDQRTVTDWGKVLLRDRHEVVRAQAAWMLARHGELGAPRVADLYMNATDVSRYGIAAAAGAIDRTQTKSEVESSLSNDGALVNLAYQWGRDAQGF